MQCVVHLTITSLKEKQRPNVCEGSAALLFCCLFYISSDSSIPAACIKSWYTLVCPETETVD